MTEKRILILEDDHERHESFLKRLDGIEIVITEKADECIRPLANEDWTALFLDHDLGGEQMVASGPGTGYEVACWLEEHKDRQPPIIFIHSLNNQGAPKMQAALPKAKWVPGLWLADDLSDIWKLLPKEAENMA